MLNFSLQNILQGSFRGLTAQSRPFPLSFFLSLVFFLYRLKARRDQVLLYIKTY